MGVAAPTLRTATTKEDHDAHVDAQLDAFRAIEVTLARLARFGYGSIEIKGEPDRVRHDDGPRPTDHYRLRWWGAVTLTLGDRNLRAKDEGLGSGRRACSM